MPENTPTAAPPTAALPTPAPPTPTPAPTSTPAPTPTPQPVDTLTPADLPGLLPALDDIAALATETAEDSPVIRPVEHGGEIPVGIESPGFVAGHATYTWGGGLLIVYSVDGTRAYFTYTDASLYETPEQAAAMVAALTEVKKEDLKRTTDELIVELDFPPVSVGILGLKDASPVEVGDSALGRFYSFSASGIIADVYELRFARGRVGARVVLGGVHKKTDSATAQTVARIIAERIEPYLLKP